MNLDISPWQVVWPRVVVIAGLSMLFAPLNVAAFLHIPRELRGAAVGLLALLAQRRRQRRDVGRPDHSGTPRAVSHAAAQRKARPAEPGRQPIAPARPGVLPATNRRRAAVAANDLASAARRCAISRPRRWPISTSSGSPRPWRRPAGVSGSAHAPLGGGEGGAYRGGVNCTRIGDLNIVPRNCSIILGASRGCSNHPSHQESNHVLFLPSGRCRRQHEHLRPASEDGRQFLVYR